MRLSRLIALALLVAAPVLAGCQPPPRPFASDRPNPLLDAPESAGIVVEPVGGLPTEPAEELRGAVVASLQAARILASTGPGNRASLHLHGEGTVAQSEQDRAIVAWRLTDSEGHEIAAFESAPELTAGSVGQDNARVIDNIVRRISQSLESSRFVAKRSDSNPTEPKIPVSVLAVEGAPSDGREALTRALQLNLRNSGVLVAEGVDADGLLVFGDVSVTPVPPDRERVSLVWTVKWPDGREVGRVTQSNEIPAGSVRRRWGATALAAAEGAAAGIVALVRQVAAAAAEQPPQQTNWKPVYSADPR